ncbi:MAG: deoxyribodipyrimidine photo-lyase [Actinobacteria bacterium]|nr:deoxyribodipyrimidine photo-lyase [Actinomycetota bacterium]
MRVVHLFSRDLRVSDNEALLAASKYELSFAFCLPQDFNQLLPIRAHSLIESLKSLETSLPSSLAIFGNLDQFVAAAVQNGVSAVFMTRNFDTRSQLQQSSLAEKLYGHGIALNLVGSNYAIEPGTIRKDDGSPLKVYTPFYRRWSALPVTKPISVDLARANTWQLPGGEIPQLETPPPFKIKAGEEFAHRTLERFLAKRVHGYSTMRDRADLGGTSHLSHALAHGEIHPRTILQRIGHSEGEEMFRKEIAWREFYADVMYHNPHTLDDYFDPKYASMRYRDPSQDAALLQAWKDGKTGFPMVDAAMRQLRDTGWMHNRARMIVASFLVKDLHFEWQVGARHFEQCLTDFDPASNSHGWQWTAGCGTDASPYFRVFNPITQGEKFDPNGDYVRRFIPELSHIPGKAVHQPWLLVDGLAHGYPAPVVDHATERLEALARLKEISG